MTLDPQIQPIVDLINAAAVDAPPVADQTPEMRREGYQALVAQIPPGPDMASVATQSIPGPGGDIDLRIYRPTSTDSPGVIVFYHGGGWCIGDLDTHDEVCRRLAAISGLAVVSVDYRLAPEHPFPAAVEDSWSALRWVSDHRQAVTGRADARIAVCGDSAGGNLSAVMALMARDKPEMGVAVSAQLLVYPSVDMTAEDYPSLAANGKGHVLTTEGMNWFRAAYLTAPGDADDWRASPLRAADLAGLPPALVITAEYDPIRDQGRAWADALTAAGVEVSYTEYPGMVHIFFQLGPGIDATTRAIEEVAAAAVRYLAD